MLSNLVLLAVLAARQALTAPAAGAFPDLPFTTSGRNIIGKSGALVTYAGVNWPGAADAMIPEGLQYQSIAKIVSKIKSLDMNVVRLTYAIELVDDILAGNPSSSLHGSFVNALGDVNGTKIYNQIIKHNPQFGPSTQRLDVYDAVARECANQGIYVHFDNHVSKAQWCCGHTDGNSWFGDEYFNVPNWKRGLKFMAKHTKSWTNLASMSLRNELRSPDEEQGLRNQTYNFQTWYNNVIDAANGIHATNPAPLIFFSGLNYDTTLQPVVQGNPLSTTRYIDGGATPNYANATGPIFNISSMKYPKKVVFELHNYQNGVKNCQAILPGLYADGYSAMNTSDMSILNHAPVVLTEFGFAQDNSSYLLPYSQCIYNLLDDVKGGFMQWVIAGSYYIRQGSLDSDESWGLLNHDWSAWRSDAALKFTKPLAQAVLTT